MLTILSNVLSEKVKKKSVVVDWYRYFHKLVFYVALEYLVNFSTIKKQ